MQMTKNRVARQAVKAAVLIIATTLFAQEETAAKAKIDGLVRASIAGKIGRVEVMRLPTYYTSQIAIGPAELDERWFYKTTIRNIRAADEEAIAKALRSANLRRTDRKSDIRWGIIFYSHSGGGRVAALYFDVTGRQGWIDEVPVSFGERLLPQLKNALHLSTE